MNNLFDIAIFGATGAVGQELATSLSRRSFPVNSLRAYASHRSVGKTITYGGEPIQVEDAEHADFNCDIAFLSSGAEQSREVAPKVLEKGGVVIDNSSAFRMDPGIPLIVPEINRDQLSRETRLIANPNCTAAITLMAVHPLRSLGKMKRLVMSTYQSASGGGAKLMYELLEQTRATLSAQEYAPDLLPFPYAFNLFSHNTAINEHGYNDEEWKVIAESRKILNMPELAIGVTCVRVPVLRAHSIALSIEFEQEAPSEEAIRNALSQASGVTVVDDRINNHFPMPIEASGEDNVLVGRIRRDVSHPSAIGMFIVGDQLLKGAALNAVQIAEAMIARKLI